MLAAVVTLHANLLYQASCENATNGSMPISVEIGTLPFCSVVPVSSTHMYVYVVPTVVYNLSTSVLARARGAYRPLGQLSVLVALKGDRSSSSAEQIITYTQT